MNFIEVIILSFVEGLTEYLPISSTGHLIIVSHFLQIKDQNFLNSFNIIIQFGAILSVLVVYFEKFKWDPEFYKKLLVSFLPAVVLGLLFKSKIEALLDSVLVVAWALVAGGILLILSDFFFKEKNQDQKRSFAQLTVAQCLGIGFFQCFAFIPGVSRSAATILAGLGFGLSKKDAAEYSFFLAVPTLTAAAGYKSLPLVKTINMSQAGALALGIFLSFLFALAAVRFFIALVSRYGFKHFGIYRILLGVFLIFMESR